MPPANKSISTTVLFACGGGRLHFVESAEALTEVDVAVDLICGVVPSARNKWIIKVLGRIVGRRDAYERLLRRFGRGVLRPDQLLSNGVAECVIQAASLLAKARLVPSARSQTLSWAFYGRMSRRHFGTHHVFHVRSGAGQGGAIDTAKKKKMKVVVDHSIAHPAFIRRALEPDYNRFGMPVVISETNVFWKQVLKDCSSADVLLVNSDFVKETFVSEGYDPGRIHVAYLGVREDFFRLKKTYERGACVKLLFTGTFELRKGLAVLVDALIELRRRNVDFELTVAGDSTEAAIYFGSKLKTLPIKLLGPLPQADLKSLLADSDLYIFPTYAEGCAKSAMEAMAAGLPVITTAACGLPGNPGSHYFECAAGDSLALANLIYEMSLDTDKRRAVGCAGADLVSANYKWSDYGRNLKIMYRNLLGGAL